MTLFIHINIIQETISTFSESFEKNGLENFIFYKKHVWEESSSSSSESMIQIHHFHIRRTGHVPLTQKIKKVFMRGQVVNLTL